MKRISILVTAAVFSTFAFLGIGPSALAASADANRLLILASSSSGDQAAVDQLNSMGDPLTATEVEALASSLSGDAFNPVGASVLADSEAVGWRFDNGDTFLSFQIEDGGLNLSSLTLVVDESLSITKTIQSVASLTASQALEVRQWIDGKLVSTETLEKGASDKAPAVKATVTSINHGSRTTVTGTTQYSTSTSGARGALSYSPSVGLQTVTNVTSQQVAAAPIATAKWRGFSLSRFNKCLSSAGVAWWVVAMVASVCFAAGVATAGIAFMACVAGTLGVGSGTTGYCFGYATYY